VIAEFIISCDGVKTHKLAEIEMLTINDIADIVLSINILDKPIVITHTYVNDFLKR
jgi:hypothetical protein